MPKGVEVNGIAVGGMPRSQAAALVRRSVEESLKEKKLEIIGEKKTYTFTYPEIYYKDNVYELLKNAKKEDKLESETSFYLCGLNSIAPNICRNESLSVVEPHYKFSSVSEPFAYFEGSDGKVVDEKKLIDDIKSSLNGGFEPVTLSFKTVKRQKSLKEVKKSTALFMHFYHSVRFV